MGIFRLKHIGLAVCLMASLLVGSASACMCSHHQVKKQAVKTSCHGVVHQAVDALETAGTGDAMDVDCTCRVNHPTPVVVSRTEEKKAKAEKRSADSPIFVQLPTPETTAAQPCDIPHVDLDLSYSHVLKSLLPSRAPPRL